MVQSRHTPSGAGRAQSFRKSVRQDRFGLGVADAVGQSRERIETVDGDVVAGRDLRSQAGQPERIERAVPEGDDVGPHARHLFNQSRKGARSDQAQARSVLALAS